MFIFRSDAIVRAMSRASLFNGCGGSSSASTRHVSWS